MINISKLVYWVEILGVPLIFNLCRSRENLYVQKGCVFVNFTQIFRLLHKDSRWKIQDKNNYKSSDTIRKLLLLPNDICYQLPSLFQVLLFTSSIFFQLVLGGSSSFLHVPGGSSLFQLVPHFSVCAKIHSLACPNKKVLVFL